MLIGDVTRTKRSAAREKPDPCSWIIELMVMPPAGNGRQDDQRRIVFRTGREANRLRLAGIVSVKLLSEFAHRSRR